MGKNTFQSLAIAASMLGMSVNKAPAQGAGDQITETKVAIEALISSLPPEQFKAAITVLEWDKALLDDGAMDTKDTTTIRDHASKLLWISKDAAQKILDSLNPHGVVPNTKEAGVKLDVKKSEPPIGGYTKEQLKRKQWEENTMKNANGILSNAQAVTYNTSDTAVASLKIVWNTRVFIVNSREKKPKSWTQVKATANFAIKWLPAGTSISYTLPKPENMKEGASEVGSVRIIFVNKEGKTIDTEWKENPGFCLSVASGQTEQFIMPEKAIWFTEKIDLPLEFDTAKWTYPDRELRIGTGVIKIMPVPEWEIVGVGK